MATFSFEEGYGPTADGNDNKFVPASRTNVTPASPLADTVADITDQPTSDKVGTLPSDPSVRTAIEAAAKKYNVPVEYAYALADQESGYKADAHNDEFGADGPFQFTPDSAKLHGLKYGVDTRDFGKSADAAMKDFSQQMAVGGTDWAIKYHFAGPNVKGHGPKTRQYLADVTKRAEDIRALLDNPDAPVLANNAKPKSNTFSFEEGYGPTLGSKPAPVQKEPVQAGFGAQAVSFLENSANAVVDSAKGTFDFVMQRMQDAPDEYLGKKKVRAERSPEEIQALMDAIPKWERGGKDWEANQREQFKYQTILQGDYGARQVEKDKAPQEEEKAGFFGNLKNPFSLLLNESLPANFLHSLKNTPQDVTDNFWKARQVAMQENIVAHPEQFPEVAVQAAQNAINARSAQQKPNIRKMWSDLKQAAKEDPGRFGASFANALVADPEMLLVPEGLGAKVIAGTKRVVTGAETVTKAAQIADKMIDAGTAGAALNLGMEAASKSAHNEDMTGSDAAFTALTGAAISAPLGIFARGAHAEKQLKAGTVASTDLEAIMRDAAAADVAREDVVNGDIHPNYKQRIEESLGISNMSDAEKKAWHKKKQAELNKTFASESQEADYQRFKAEERIQRTQQLIEEAKAKQEAEAAAAAKSQSTEAAYLEERAARTQRYQSDYEQALAQRDAAAMGQHESEAYHENALRDQTAKLDEQDIIDAAYSGTNEVKQAMVRAAQRDSKLRVPKWQRGEVDPRLVARLGIGSLFAGTAYALAPEDNKGGAAFAAGLAGMLIPGGGRVLDRMRQSGMVSDEGNIIGLLVEQGKLKASKTADEIRLAEAEQIGRAKQGDQTAYRDLYNANFPRIKRFVKQFVREAGPRLGIDAEDVAQETMVKAFKNLDKFNGTSGLYTWLYAIARNEGLMAIRDAKNLKGGGDYNITSMHAASGVDAPGDLGAGHLEGGNSSIKSEVEGAAPDLDTPEGLAVQEETKQQLVKAIQKLPEKRREIFLLSRVEQYSIDEIAKMKNLGVSDVKMNIARADEAVHAELAKDYGVKPPVAKPETSAGIVPDAVKRGRGRPRKQAGEVDPRLLVTLTGVAGTAALGAYLVDNSDGKHSKTTAALGGAALGLLLFGHGAHGLSAAAKMLDEGVGVASTRLLHASPKIFRRAQNAERHILENTHIHIAEVDPFLVRLHKLPQEGQQIVTRALLTGHSGVISRVLEAVGDPELTGTYKRVRSVLDSLGDQLVALNRFKKGAGEYFPRIVKDKEGLFKAIGKEQANTLKEILDSANAESIRKNGRPLSQIEEAALINQTLFVDKRSMQPGWSKHRGIEEITPELLQYYATPSESIHTYIRAAVQDIEKAKFFGRYAKNMPKGQFEFLDTDRSVNNMLAEEIKSGDITHDQANEIATVLKARFGKGEMAESDLIRNIKNVGNIGLLGNLWSAASQLADVALQVHVQSFTSTLQSVSRNLTGRSILSIKDLGLVDHISEEFANQLKTTRWLNRFFKVSLFAGMDKFGKNVALNAAVIKAKGLASTDSGVLRLANKYQDMFGDDFTKLVSELKTGKITDLTKEYAWLELSRTQPISRLEMPTAYLNHPNLRTFWWLKSFTLKQFDLLRRDAYDEIKKGNRAKGLANLMSAGVAMGVGGAGTQVVKDWMLGRDIKLGPSEIVLNMFRNLGFSQYTMDHITGVTKEDAAARRADGDANARAQRATPLEAIADVVAPPYKMFQDILTGSPNATRYLAPVIGPWLAERAKNAEIERKRLEKEEKE